jgi:two-component system chemotaxis response regulator CheB
MDGLEALPKLLAAKPGLKVIVASTLTRRNAEISLRAIQLGATDYIAKPGSSKEINTAESFKREFLEKVRVLAATSRGGGAAAVELSGARDQLRPAVGREPQIRVRQPGTIVLQRQPSVPPKVIAIGSSTGGPQALARVVAGLAPAVRQPILITQHMPPTFTTLLAEHLAKVSGIGCAEALDGEPLVGHRIYLAPGGRHMVVERSGREVVVRLSDSPPENFCRPAVDPMLRSLSEIYGSGVLVIILTGMGSDGLKGAESIVSSGGTVIAQDEKTSVVWGMPGAVATAGLCSAVLPLEEIAPYVQKIAMRSAA